ncbi:MAG: GTPase Era [Syntrophobacterales bacterium]|nr:GTPase Era [Syntrophobacterales bacterium]
MSFKSGYVSIIGAPNVGKSTLINAIVGEKISITSPKPQTTRNRIAGIYTDDRCQIVFVDTPGIHKSKDLFNEILVSTALSTVGDVDVLCFMVEPINPPGRLDMLILEKVISRLSNPTILVINKIDVVPAKNSLLPLIDFYSKQHSFYSIIPISALLGDGVKELVDRIVEILPEGPKYFPQDQITDLPERFIVAELIREQIFNLTHEEVPYSVHVSIERFEDQPDRNLVIIEATIHAEKDSQKGIIIGKGGKMLKEIGRLARINIEKFLGKKVFLQLYVRVQERWRRDKRILAEWGFRLKSPSSL